jgi:hypothetical protein
MTAGDFFSGLLEKVDAKRVNCRRVLRRQLHVLTQPLRLEEAERAEGDGRSVIVGVIMCVGGGSGLQIV